jgi:hypothetical protein
MLVTSHVGTRQSVIKTIHESSRPSDSVPNHAAPVDTTSRLLISQPSVSDAAASRRIVRKVDRDELKHRQNQLVKQRDKSRSRSNTNRVGDKLPEGSSK